MELFAGSLTKAIKAGRKSKETSTMFNLNLHFDSQAIAAQYQFCAMIFYLCLIPELVGITNLNKQ